MNPRTLAVMMAVLILATAQPACDAQAGSGYHGIPLATVTGVVNNGMTGAAPGAVQAALEWGQFYTYVGNNSWFELTTPVSGDFPARFKMDLYTPPPEDAYRWLDFTRGGAASEESRVAIAVIAASEDNYWLPPPSDDNYWLLPLGICEDYVLVHVESDVKAGTLTEQFLGGRLTAGYHLLAVDRSGTANRDEEQVDACTEAAWGRCWVHSDNPDSWHIDESKPGCSRVELEAADAACDPYYDQLSPAPQDLETEITITLVDRPADRPGPDNGFTLPWDPPEWWVPAKGVPYQR